MRLEWSSDPFVCVSGFESVLFSIWAIFTALGSFFATGGCGTHNNKQSHFLECRTSEDWENIYIAPYGLRGETVELYTGILMLENCVMKYFRWTVTCKYICNDR